MVHIPFSIVKYTVGILSLYSENILWFYINYLNLDTSCHMFFKSFGKYFPFSVLRNKIFLKTDTELSIRVQIMPWFAMR